MTLLGKYHDPCLDFGWKAAQVKQFRFHASEIVARSRTQMEGKGGPGNGLREILMLCV